MNALTTRKDGLPLGTAQWQGADWGLQTFTSGSFRLGWSEKGNCKGAQDDRHVLVVSGPRSGKGAALLIPNLATWPGSVVVIDPKGENAKVAARRRGKGSAYCAGMSQVVHLLDPMKEVRTGLDDFDDIRASYNPLDQIRTDRPESIDDADRIADSLFVWDGQGERFWYESARRLVSAIILHVATSKDFWQHERNLITVGQLVMRGHMDAYHEAVRAGVEEPLSPFGYLFESMKRNRAFGDIISGAGLRFGTMEGTAAKTFEGIISNAQSNLDFLKSPGMADCLRTSSFDLSDLKTDPKGISVFLTLPQRYMDTHFRWLRMMTSLMLAEMERTAQQPACGHPVLTVLDEFAGLKRMTSVENAAAQIAGFGVKLCFVVQNLGQLKEHYKDNWETFVASAGTKVFFGVEDNFTREYASKLVGDTETIRILRNESASETHTNGWGGSETKGTSITDSASRTHAMGSGPYRTPNDSHTVGVSRAQSSGSGTNWSGSYSRSVTRGISESLHKRPLVSPDEIGRQFGDRSNPTALVLRNGQQPMVVKLENYFSDPFLDGLYDPHPDHAAPPTLAMRGLALLEQAKARKAEQAKRELDDRISRARWAEASKRAAEEAKRRKEWQAQLDADRAAQKRLEEKAKKLAALAGDVLWVIFLAPIVIGGTLVSMGYLFHFLSN